MLRWYRIIRKLPQFWRLYSQNWWSEARGQYFFIFGCYRNRILQTHSPRRFKSHLQKAIRGTRKTGNHKWIKVEQASGQDSCRCPEQPIDRKTVVYNWQVVCMGAHVIAIQLNNLTYLHYQKKYLNFFGFFHTKSAGLSRISNNGPFWLNLANDGKPKGFFCYFSCTSLIFLLFWMFLYPSQMFFASTTLSSSLPSSSSKIEIDLCWYLMACSISGMS